MSVWLSGPNIESFSWGRSGKEEIKSTSWKLWLGERATRGERNISQLTWSGQRSWHRTVVSPTTNDCIWERHKASDATTSLCFWSISSLYSKNTNENINFWDLCNLNWFICIRGEWGSEGTHCHIRHTWDSAINRRYYYKPPLPSL